MTYKLWIDDNALDENMESFRKPPQSETDWKIAITSKQACLLVKEFGIPEFIEFDHDLGMLHYGKTDTAMNFLHWLYHNYPDAIKEIKGWNIHSRNPEGSKNIEAFMSSWKRSQE